MDTLDQKQAGTEITRREALRKGLMLGGAVLWTTPVVQAIGITPALASETSTTCCFDITLAIEGDTSGPVAITQSGWTNWRTTNCNCGTHSDDDRPSIVVKIASPETVWASLACALNGPGGCTGQDHAEKFSSTGLPNGDYEVYAVVSGTQGGNSCSAQSNKVKITVS